ncbi:MAG: DUF502 domain-containing protein [Bacteroidetes bacterium]|nr:DUF502 domain-containing protein [Bacteroidota bacterium]
MMKQPSLIRRLIQTFFQGLIILAPIAITAWAVVSLFKFIDSILPNLIAVFFGPEMLSSSERITGLGFLLVIGVVLMVGYISSTFIVSKLVELFDNVLERTPGVRIIYSTVRDFFEAFAGNKRRFDRAVLVSIESPEIWRVGFITQEELLEFGLKDHIAVYVPHSYAFSGVVYLVPRDRVRMLSDITPGDAMKFAISGGVTDIEDDAASADTKGENTPPTGKETA